MCIQLLYQEGGDIGGSRDEEGREGGLLPGSSFFANISPV